MAAALGANQLPYDCKKCRTIPGLRERWGCDAPTTELIAFSKCPRCLGDNPKCTKCNGDPRGVPIERCPLSQSDSRLGRLIRAYSAWDKGISPVDGGFMAQANAFVEAVALFNSEAAEWHQRSMDEIQEKRKRG